MTSTQWRKILASWSDQVLASDLVQHLDPADRNLKYLGFPPASTSSLDSLESRLGVRLPPSYRTFLETTDGFRVISPFTYRLRPTIEVDWFRVENQGWVETCNEPTIYDDPDRPEPSDEEYFDYTNPNEHNFRRSHLFAMLQVSDVDDGVMLLNPLAVTPDGEWEAWFLANWIPGAHRYASFAHMMVDTYRSLHELEIASVVPKLPKVEIPGPTVPRHSVIDSPRVTKPKRKIPKRKRGQSHINFVAQFMTSFVEQQVAPAPSELFQLLNDLKNGDSKIRAKTTRILQGKLKVRAMSTRHPDVIPLATELACGLSEPEARCACVGLLTNITPDGPVPAWLLTAMTDPHPWVLQTGLSAIHYFNGPELVEPIIQILSASDDMLVLENAATALAEIPDLRAVPALAAQLESAPPSRAAIRPHALQQMLQRYYVSVALGLARYGKHALSRLVPLLTHPDSNRRIAAIIALRVIGDVGTRDTVANLKSDLDAGVRQQAERCDKIWGDGAGFPPHIIS